MKFKIRHETEYSFDSDVFLEPHHLRLRPQKTPFCEILDFSLCIKKDPVGLRAIQDEESNHVDFCWFDGLTQKLSISTESIISIKEYNPFDFIVHPVHFKTIPFEYSAQERSLLHSTIERMTISDHLVNYGKKVLAASYNDSVQFVINLTRQIHDDFVVVYREAGAPMLPDETYSLKAGSCRDLSWMQINLLRNLGYAARFVSGYLYFDMEKPSYELHGWTEVFLPGAGWFGLDPSHGMLTGNTHFPLASSAHFQNTMPVSGGFRGDASSKLITQLFIETIKE